MSKLKFWMVVYIAWFCLMKVKVFLQTKSVACNAIFLYLLWHTHLAHISQEEWKDLWKMASFPLFSMMLEVVLNILKESWPKIRGMVPPTVRISGNHPYWYIWTFSKSYFIWSQVFHFFIDRLLLKLARPKIIAQFDALAKQTHRIERTPQEKCEILKEIAGGRISVGKNTQPGGNSDPSILPQNSRLMEEFCWYNLYCSSVMIGKNWREDWLQMKESELCRRTFTAVYSSNVVVGNAQVWWRTTKLVS